MSRAEIVIDCNYGGLNPVQFGMEDCSPGHAFGPAVRTHWLLHYVHSGSGTFLREGKEYSVRAGEIFVIPPYLETFYQANEKDPWVYTWIGFTTSDALPELFRQPVISCPEAEGVFTEMARCGNYDSGRSAFLSSCLWKLVGILLEAGQLKTDYVDKALNCIRSEYATGLTVQAIADRLNLDRSYFSTLFTKRVGIPPRDYLQNFRLNKAAELLTLYGEKPSTAALSVGYDDLFHFSKAFKHHFGIPPREYAKRFKDKQSATK